MDDFDFDFTSFANFNFNEDELTFDVPSPHSERSGKIPQHPDLFSITHTEEISKRQGGSCQNLSGVSSGAGRAARSRRKGNASPSDSKSPLQGLVALKNFTGVQKKTTRDGQTPKRRGPKPDSKPAQTRRQELNRQAQRTHRERKEHYIKALEIELSRLREGYSSDIANVQTTLQQHKEALQEHKDENAVLKNILSAHGISFERELESRRGMRHGPSSLATSTSGSRTGSHGQTLVTPATTVSSGLSPSPGLSGSDYGHYNSKPSGSQSGSRSGGSQVGYNNYHASSHETPGIIERAVKQEDVGISDLPGVFEEDPQLGVDFILALESPCRDHSEYLVRRAFTSPDEPDLAQFSGHALMASCAPPTHISTTPALAAGLQPTYPHKTYDNIPPANLSTLLNLSRQLVEGGQVTPIMALQSLKSHDRYRSLTREDVKGMIDDLNNKVRCYGFGAVLEDFELKDALSSIFATKFETYDRFTDVQDMYS